MRHSTLVAIETATYKTLCSLHEAKRRNINGNPDYSKQLAIRITTSRCLIKPVVLFILIFYASLSVTGACTSRSSPPKPKPTVGPIPRPNITFHTYACPPMYASWYCLNGATCFTVKIGEHTLYNCECAEGYMGPRCEFKDLDSSYLLSKKQILLESASIAFGATLAILLVVIVCASLYIRYNQKQKQKKMFEDCVDGGFKRKPFSRRIPATHLPLVKTSSQQMQQYSSPPNLDKINDTNYFVLPSVRNTFDIEMCNKETDEVYLKLAHKPTYVRYLLLREIQFNEENNRDNGRPKLSKECQKTWHTRILPLCLNIIRRIELLFTIEIPLKRICAKLMEIFLTQHKNEQIFRHTDIVELCNPIVIPDYNTQHLGYNQDYKLLTVVPRVYIPTETNVLYVNSNIQEITPQFLSVC